MSKEMDAKEMVHRLLVVAELLTTVATPEEIRATNHGKAHSITPLPVRIESNAIQQSKHLEVKR